MVILFNNAALVITAVKPEFVEPRSARLEHLQLTRTEQFPYFLNSRLDRLVGELEFQPKAAVDVQELPAVVSVDGGGIAHTGNPGSTCADGIGMNRRLCVPRL